MASQIGLIRAKLNLDAAGFRQGLERAQSAAATFQKKMRRVEYRMQRFGRSMESAGRSMTMGLTAPILGAAGAAVRSAAKFESLGVQMEVLTGSAEEGARAFQRLKEFSARTPFQLADLTRAQNTLMGFGLSVEDAFEHLQRLGDIAAVTGGDLQAISVAFGQSAAEGKLLTRDIRQLINQGVPAIKLLADSMGVAQSEVLDLAEQGEISFEILSNAIEKATREGGMFANGTQRLANTLTGVWSTFRDNVELALGELGMTITETLDLKAVAKNVSEGIQNITKNFQALSSDTKIQVLKIAGLLAAGGPLLIAIGKFAKAIAALSAFVRSKFFIMASAVALIAIAGQNLVDNWIRIKADLKSIFLEVTKAGLQMTEKMLQFNQITTLGLSSGINKTLASIRRSIKETTADLDHQNRVAKNLESGWVDWGDSAKNAADNLRNALGRLINIGMEASGVNQLMALLTGPTGSMGGDSGFGENPISTQGLSQSIDNISRSLETMKAKGAEAGTVTQVALRGIKDRTQKATMAAGAFGETMADAFAQAALHGKNLLDILENIAKQLAARAFVKGIGALLTGGASLGAGGFLGAVFGFAQGGRPPTHQVSLVGEQGPELFVPDTAGTVVPITPNMGGSQVIHNVIQLDGRTVFENQKEVSRRVNR